MRFPVFILAGALLGGTPVIAQSSDCASVTVTENEVTVSSNSWDPVLAVATTLHDRYGIRVSVESPKWAFPVDTEDVAIADPQFSAHHENVHYLMMKRHIVQVRFKPADAPPPDSLLHELLEQANKEMPYAYRLDTVGDEYVLVPTKTRNSAGELEEVKPLLDHHVSIPAGLRPIAQHARLMADQLSEQTGLHVSCCQTLVAGVPWGQAEVLFHADDEPARGVLRELIRLEQQQDSQGSNRHPRHPPYDYWTVRCDGTGAPWCFIEVRSPFTSQCQNLPSTSPF
jgi:hypothetical protein